MTAYPPPPGDIRPSQLVSTFGPGAIYDNLKDSLIIMGIDKWERRHFRPLRHETLLYHLKNTGYRNLKELRVPIRGEEGDARHVRVSTFPTWGMCKMCKMLQKRNLATGEGIRCSNRGCGGLPSGGARETVPVRFVVACRNGHLDDFPWYKWAHRNGGVECDPDKAKLFLEDTPGKASLEHKYVACRTCGSRASLGGAFSEGSMKAIYPAGCTGSMPWLETNEKCTNHENPSVREPVRGMYKGSTSMYFPHTVRALTIPPFDNPIADQVSEAVETMRSQNKPSDAIEELVPQMFDVSVKTDVVEIIRAHVRRTGGDGRGDGTGGVKSEEYRQLNSQRHPERGANTPDFVTEPIEVPESFADTVENAVLVKNLREIVALTGFYRICPPVTRDDQAQRKAPLGVYRSGSPTWLPATENRGEGIFIALDGQRVSQWIKDTPEAELRYRGMLESREHMASNIDAVPDARYILLHTVSHMLIREVSAQAGYSTASIRERVYSGDDMAGILIYTSSPSSDGSLGGLVEQGVKPRLDVMMRRMLRKSTACSTDPFCSGSSPSEGADNGAACHACLFLPETSCECMNMFLDRAVVVRVAGNRWGYFAK